jgi:site-specific recombinase XerD
MPIKIKSNLDYQQFCDEMGITLEDIKFLQSQKLNNFSFPIAQTSAPLITDILVEYKNHILKLNKKKKRADSTIKTYTNFFYRLNKFIVDKDSTLTILNLNEDLLMEMLNNSKPRKNDTISINTYNKYGSILRKLIFYCYDKGYINKDLSYRFPIQNTDTHPRYLTLEQLMDSFSKALQKSYGYRCRAMLIFLAGTGCRVSELVNLRVSDFNIKEKMITSFAKLYQLLVF